MTDLSLRLERLECVIDDIRQEQQDLSERLDDIESRVRTSEDIADALDALGDVRDCYEETIEETRRELCALIDSLKDTVDDLTLDVERLSMRPVTGL